MITRIEQNENHKWGCQSDALRAQFLKELGSTASQYATKEIVSILDIKMEAKKLENLKTCYLQDDKHSKAFPGYGSLLSNSKTTTHVVKEFDGSLRRMVAENEQLIRDKLVEETP